MYLISDEYYYLDFLECCGLLRSFYLPRNCLIPLAMFVASSEFSVVTSAVDDFSVRGVVTFRVQVPLCRFHCAGTTKFSTFVTSNEFSVVTNAVDDFSVRGTTVQVPLCRYHEIFDVRYLVRSTMADNRTGLYSFYAVVFDF